MNFSKKISLLVLSFFLSFTLHAKSFSQDDLLECVTIFKKVAQNKDSLQRDLERTQAQHRRLINYDDDREKLYREIKSAEKKTYNCNPNIKWGSEACHFARNNYNTLVAKWNKDSDRRDLIISKLEEFKRNLINKRDRLTQELDQNKKRCFEDADINKDDFVAVCKKGAGKNSSYCKAISFN